MDPLAPDPNDALAMTHWPPAPVDPRFQEINRRLQMTGQNLYNTWLGPAERLGRAATSGTLDVTDPATAGAGLQVAGTVAGARMPFAKAGELGSSGGKPFWIESPAMATHANELIAQGESTRGIARGLGMSEAQVRQYLAASGQKTAASEIPSIWDNPANIEEIRRGIANNRSLGEIARRIETTPGNVWTKIKRMQAAGEFPEYAGQRQGPTFFNDPERMDRLEQLGKEGWSIREMARDPLLAAADHKTISKWIKGMQARGRMMDWVPLGSSNVTAAGRTPTLPQFETLRKSAPEADPGYMSAATEFLRRNYPEQFPLQRQVIARDARGRPIRTAPLPIGNENAILEAGARLNEPPPFADALSR